MNTRGKVLILYNNPRPNAKKRPTLWQESDAGVLNEVHVVAAALERLGIAHRRAAVRSLADVPPALARGRERIVFNLVESLEGDTTDFCLVPALCRAMRRGVTGNDAACQTLTLDKWLTKAVLQAHGIPTPCATVVRAGAEASRPGLPGGVLIVKPLSADASEGIDGASVVQSGNARAMAAAVRRVHRQFKQPALVEQFIAGREFNVAVLQRGAEIEVLPLAEIDFSAFPPGKPRIVDYAAKWLENSFEYVHTPRKIPADVPERIAQRIRLCAMAAWRAVGCQDYARVDFRLDAAGNPFVLEVNANPDLSPDCGFAAALTAAGISFDDFVAAMVANAGQRIAKALSA
jgi:D-alanine-D-alanine ligase